jgi:hypothetical protein
MKKELPNSRVQLSLRYLHPARTNLNGGVLKKGSRADVILMSVQIKNLGAYCYDLLLSSSRQATILAIKSTGNGLSS